MSCHSTHTTEIHFVFFYWLCMEEVEATFKRKSSVSTPFPQLIVRKRSFIVPKFVDLVAETKDHSIPNLDNNCLSQISITERSKMKNLNFQMKRNFTQHKNFTLHRKFTPHKNNISTKVTRNGTGNFISTAQY